MSKTREFVCEQCGSPYIISDDTFYRRRKIGLPNYCKQCMKKYADKKRAEAFSKLTPEEQKEFIDKRNWYARASKERQEEHRQKMRAIEAAKTPEQKAEENRKNSLGLKRHWKTVSTEAKTKRTRPMQKAIKSKIDSMSEAEQKAFYKNRYNNWSDESKRVNAERGRVSITKYNASLTDEEKLERVNHMNEYMNSLPKKERRAIARKAHQWYHNLDLKGKMEYVQSKRDFWNNKPIEERKIEIRTKLSKSKVNNKFCQRFEELFNNSILNDYFYFVPEVVIGDDVLHSWDYGIYDQNGTLVAVVDLDGEFYHADVCDYDGIHSQEEYDERRGLTIPVNVKYCIINERNIDACFHFMLDMLMMTYQGYQDYLFKLYRAMPFPEPKYYEIKLIKSYRTLQRMDCNDKYHRSMSINPRLGDMLIYQYHPSIWHQALPGKISPYDAWYDDNVLKQHIEDHILYHTHLNKNKILQGFVISPTAPRIRFMSGGRAKMIINRYLSDYDTIFDPNIGYGGRMLGTVSTGKKYVGICADEVLIRENTDMIEFIKQYFGIDVVINSDSTEYPCMFTEVANDDQITEYLSTYKCGRYVFITDSTELYSDYVVEIYSDGQINRNNHSVIIIERED